MAAKSKKKKQGKTERIAKATTELIYEAYKDFRDDPHRSGRKFEGRLALSEPLHVSKHGKLRLLLIAHLEKKGFQVTFLNVGRRDEVDSVTFMIGRNDH